MRFVTIFASIAVAVTTASAQPVHEESSGRISYVAPKLKPKLRVDGAWIKLASPTPVKHGTEFIIVGAEAGRFSQLRIDAQAGTVILLRLRVFDADGTVHTVPLGRTLDREHDSTVIALSASKAIDQIAITTATHTRGMYVVYGSSGGTGIAAR